MSDSKQSFDKRTTWGDRLIRFCGSALIISSGVKFVHASKPVAYMASMGFEGSTFYVVAILELLSAILFLVPATRRLGLLLVSSYLGGAIAAHLAVHRFFTGGPFLVYMATHPYVGAIVPSVVLFAGWIGVGLCPPQELGLFAGDLERIERASEAAAGQRIAFGSSS
jgi:hypothetical protein